MEVLPDESLRERCGCQTTTQPEGDEDEDEDEDEDDDDDEDVDVENKQLVQQVAEYESENSALRNALCATALADALEWQEDADVVEITDTSLTMSVTEDVVLYTLCHTACSSSCGIYGRLAPIYEDQLVCDGGVRTPVSTFFNGTGALWSATEEIVMNVLGTEEDGAEVSVKMVVWNPVHDDANSTVRFDARFANDGDMHAEGDELPPPAPEGDRRSRRRRRRRRHLTQQQTSRGTDTRRAAVSRSATSRRVSTARVTSVASMRRADVVSRASVSQTQTRLNTAARAPDACGTCKNAGFICEAIPAPLPPNRPPPLRKFDINAFTEAP